MQTVLFTHNHSRIKAVQLHEVLERLRVPQQHMAHAISQGYATEYASLALPDDHKQLEMVTALIEKKKSCNPEILVVIGIGGSNLGTMAVHQACMGSLYNERSGMRVYYVDTVDSDHTQEVAARVEHALNNKKSVLINLISKSGNTTESIANFEIFIAVLQKYTDSYHDYVIVTTDKDSPLWHVAQTQKFACLEIPKNVGGRYSVLSPVGLFPLGLMGIDIHALLAGALQARNASLYKDDTSSMISAALLWLSYHQGNVIHDTFLFSPDLENLGKWYRQLLAESIGKIAKQDGKEVSVGIVPTVSIGSTDLHSMAQLYLAGPHRTFTSFVTVGKNKTSLQVPHLDVYDQLVKHIQGVDFATIMQAILQGVQVAYSNGKRPFITWQLPEKSSYCIGQLLQYKMLEVMYLGYLFDINPFDQPQVELYKQETRKLLSHE